MQRPTHLLLRFPAAVMATVTIGTLAFAQSEAPAPRSTGPLQAAPECRSGVGQITGSVPLSDQQSRSKGIICPPAGVDPGIAIPPVGGGRAPVISPPGTPDGDVNRTQVRVLDAAQIRRANMERRGERIIESSVEARQGFLGRPVLLVLVVSCVLAAATLAPSFGCLRARLAARRRTGNAAPERLAPDGSLFPACKQDPAAERVSERRLPRVCSLFPGGGVRDENT
jgi:hypothetical protein